MRRVSAGPSGALSSQFAHLRITGTGDLRAVREAEGRTEFDQMPHGVRHIVLLFLREGVPQITWVCNRLPADSRPDRLPDTDTMARWAFFSQQAEPRLQRPRCAV